MAGNNLPINVGWGIGGSPQIRSPDPHQSKMRSIIGPLKEFRIISDDIIISTTKS